MLGVGIYFFNKYSNSNSQKYQASKTAVNANNTATTNNNRNKTVENQTNTTNVENNNIEENSPQSEAKTEELLTTFSTQIYTKDASRQNDVTITCQTLNGTIVANGTEFSFCNTVGQASPDKGYQKAEIFDKNGNKIQGYGGGNCQISSTLYNAVLQVPGLTVTERHPHSNKVPYIQTGKDAAVAYGSYDLKFRNESGFNIKILGDELKTTYENIAAIK